MANGIPDFRVTQQFPIAQAAELLQRRPVLEEQIAASQQQRELEPLEFALKAAQVGSTLASQSLERAATRQNLSRRQELQELVSGSFEPQIQAVRGQISELDQLTARRIGQQFPTTIPVRPPQGPFIPTGQRARPRVPTPGPIGPPTARTFEEPIPGALRPAAGELKRGLQQQVTGLQQQQQLQTAFAGLAPKEFVKAKLAAPDLKAQLQLQKLRQELSTDSTAVTAVKKTLKEQRFTASELKELSLFELQKLSAGKATADKAKFRGAIASSLGRRVEEGIEVTTLKELGKVAQIANPGTSTSDVMKANVRRSTAASRMVVLAQKLKGKLTPQEFRESVTILAGLLAGGQSGRLAVEQIDELSVDTLGVRFANMKQFITAQPTDARVGLFLNRIISVALREAQETEQTLRGEQIKILNSRRPLLEARNPKAYKEMITGLGLNPDLVRKGRVSDLVKDPNYRSFLPLFDPFRLNVDDIVSGKTPLTVEMLANDTVSGAFNAADADEITNLNEALNQITSPEALDAFEAQALQED